MIDLSATMSAKSAFIKEHAAHSLQPEILAAEPPQLPARPEPDANEIVLAIGKLRGYPALLRLAAKFEGTYCAQAAHDLAWAYNGGHLLMEVMRDGAIDARVSHPLKRFIDMLKPADMSKLILQGAEFVLTLTPGEQCKEIVKWLEEYRDELMREV